MGCIHNSVMNFRKMEEDIEVPEKILLNKVPIQNRLKNTKKLKIRETIIEPIYNLEETPEEIALLREPDTKTTIVERAMGQFAERDELSVNSVFNHSLSDGPPFICKLCNSWFSLGTKLELHYIVNHDIFHCEICTCLFETLAEKNEHCAQYHRNIYCEICQKEIKSRSDLLKHYESEHNAVACTFCGFLIKPRGIYGAHLEKKHLICLEYIEQPTIIAEKREAEIEYFCGLCNKSREIDIFYGHMRSYHKIHNTSLMNLVENKLNFKINGAKLEEKNTGKKTNSTKHTCNICQIKFTKKIPASFHSVYCLGKTICKHCNKTFDSPELYEMHLQNSHLKFPCILGCEKLNYNTELNLSKHYNKFHDIILCRYCDVFISLNNDKFNNHLLEFHNYTSNIMKNFTDSLFEVTENNKNKNIVICCLCDENITLLIKTPNDINAHFHQIHSVSLKRITQLITQKPVLEEYDEFYQEINDEIQTNVTPEKPPDPMHKTHYSDSDLKQDFDPQQIEILYNYYTDEEEENYECAFCNEAFVNVQDLINHLKDVHRVKAILKESKCDKCKQTYFNEISFLKHFEKHKPNSTKLFNCSCDNKVLFTLAYRHILQFHSHELDTFDVDRVGIKCRYCELKYWKRIELNDHEVEVHFAENSTDFLKCYKCLTIFSSQNCLKDHKCHQDATPFTQITYKCLQCTAVFPNIELVREHFNVEHPEFKAYVCPVPHCYKTILRIKSLKNHMRMPHPLKKKVAKAESCKICGKISKNQRSATIHMLMKHRREKAGFQCRLCRERFPTIEQRKLHYATKHPGELAYSCLICGKGFLSKSGLYGHKKIHQNNEFFECKYCNKHFTRKDSYNEHLLIHIGPRHQCPHCQKAFTQRSNLTRHVRIHTGQKPYACTYCEKKFSDQGSCRSHERVHTKEEHCECSYCGKKFSKWQKLKYHIKFHTGEGLVDCEVCGKQFSNTYSLGEHRKIHNQQTLVMCNCGRGFSSEKYLQRHMANVHGDPQNTRKYLCPICYKPLSHKSSYLTHIMTHANVKHIKCTLCDKEYQTRRTVRKHLIEQHNLTPSADYTIYFKELTPQDVGLNVPPASEMATVNCNELLDDENVLRINITQLQPLDAAEMPESRIAPLDVSESGIKMEVLSEEDVDDDVALVCRAKRKDKTPVKYSLMNWKKQLSLDDEFDMSSDESE